MREQHPGQLDPVEELSSLTLVVCPDCGATAEVERQSTLHSSQGPVALAKIRCMNRHWFLMPRDGLVPASLAASSASTLQGSRGRIWRRQDHDDRSQQDRSPLHGVDTPTLPTTLIDDREVQPIDMPKVPAERSTFRSRPRIQPVEPWTP